MSAIALPIPPQSIVHLIRTMADKGGRILAITHEAPDGDAIGSLAAFGHMATRLGIDMRLYCESPLPEHLNWLNIPIPICSTLPTLLGDAPWLPDGIVFLDCADNTRAGEAAFRYVAAAKARGAVTVCIDHHISNQGFADNNWILPAAPATGILVASLAGALGFELSGDLGEAIYLAVVSDTGSFTYSNTSAEALAVAANIVGEGFSVADFTQKYENNWSLKRMHLWGQLMSEVTLVCDGLVVVSIITDDHLKRFGVSDTDLEGFASWLRRLAGVKVVLVSRVSDRGAKVNLRSMGDTDVQAIATQFGGGGHAGAAGVDIAADPKIAADMVLQAICSAIGAPA